MLAITASPSPAVPVSARASECVPRRGDAARRGQQDADPGEWLEPLLPLPLVDEDERGAPAYQLEPCRIHPWHHGGGAQGQHRQQQK
jgi:hypothetical protein